MNLEGQSKGNLQVYRKKGIVFLSVPLARRFFHGSRKVSVVLVYGALFKRENHTKKKIIELFSVQTPPVVMVFCCLVLLILMI